MRRLKDRLTPLLLLIVAGMVLAGMYEFRGFVQDDSFISLRYARNLVDGHGLVFNPGERTEGFTNMSWTLLGAACLRLGLPALLVWQVLGALAGVALTAQTFFLGLSAGLSRAGAFAAAALVASSTTLHAWSASGLEMTAFASLVAAAVQCWLLDRRYAAYGLLGVAQWTRPEAALVAAILFFVRVRESRSDEPADRRVKNAATEALAFAFPFVALLGLRLWYYGSTVPNTYLVKGGGSAACHLLGLRKIEELANFGGNLRLWGFALMALIPPLMGPPPEASRPGRAREPGAMWATFFVGFVALVLADAWLNEGAFRREPTNPVAALAARVGRGALPLYWTLLSGILGGVALQAIVYPSRARGVAIFGLIWMGYLYYFARIGGDLLPMHRLFLPALPFQALLAVLGAERVASRELLGGFLLPGDDPLPRAEARGMALGIAASIFLWAGAESFTFTRSQGHYRTVQGALDACHGAAGRDIERIAQHHGFRPKVLSQDMGALPVNGMGCDYVDAIGLTDKPIATILWKYRYSPYFRYLVWDHPPSRAAIDAMEAELRAYIDAVRPDYAVINAHMNADQTEKARAAMSTLDVAIFKAALLDNTFFYRWADSKVFKDEYVPMKVYEYSPIHFLVSFRRKDRPGLVAPGRD